MTNNWVDIKNANVVLIMGGNAAEAHPVGFKWVVEAQTKNDATVVVVDPRFNRSAAVADLYATDPCGFGYRVPAGCHSVSAETQARTVRIRTPLHQCCSTDPAKTISSMTDYSAAMTLKNGNMINRVGSISLMSRKMPCVMKR
ncbi:formate dehydrogenase, nitrate-inducible, major subunit [Citrobacter koseri]|uniref:Formate dehydrogenase, nitrate-inducible, major subunit n=1 Tax=Citrobacter koseri TaxID=545 RepID=A0A3S4JN22_CITKO|nr:formate dehydrogenase, nitrate-inducible, major subunit [Citrobacter koseri]